MSLGLTIAEGGDTDTNACIVGGLIGAAVGFNGLPKFIREKVLACDTTESANKKATHIRPAFLCPYKCGLLEKIKMIVEKRAIAPEFINDDYNPEARPDKIDEKEKDIDGDED